MRVKSLVKGLMTFIPGAQSVLPKGTTGGTNTAAYCYQVWLKHLTMLAAHGQPQVPESLAELGPGDSLGIGLSAMLSGIDKYYALDVVEYSNVESNLEIFDQLVHMFQSRAGRPYCGWPDYDQYLDDSLFPSHVLTEDQLSRSLSPHRIAKIRSAIKDRNFMDPDREIEIRYMVPWSDSAVIKSGSVDLILSHSVLEHVVELRSVYQALHEWLKPGGVMTHQVDFSDHGMTGEWNGHRACPEWLWKLVVGRREFLINRVPVSGHLSFVNEIGFNIICMLENFRHDGVSRARLTKSWRTLSDEDLHCSELFIQAQKPAL